MPLPSRTFLFETFKCKVPTRELLRVGCDGTATPIPLGLRASDLLLFFLERPGELVTKDQIMDAVWPDRVVEESNCRFRFQPSAGHSMRVGMAIAAS